MSAVYFTIHDIIFIGQCRAVIQPPYEGGKKPKGVHAPFKKFYTKNDNADVVDKITNQYIVVYSLHIIKTNYNKKVSTLQANDSSGLSVADIRNFILQNCEYTLPVNIVTNNPLLWSILKYIFVTQLPMNDWTIIPFECCQNKKNEPKVMIWNVCNQIYKNQTLSLAQLEQFMEQYPVVACNYIAFQKKHIYISKEGLKFVDTDTPRQQRQPPIPKYPYSFMSKYSGNSNCFDQGYSQAVVNLILSKNPKNNENIANVMSYLECKKFINIYTS